MTRKDYILIADGFIRARKLMEDYESNMEHFFKTVEYIADNLKYQNNRFDKEHFLAVVRGEKDLNSRPYRKAAR